MADAAEASDPGSAIAAVLARYPALAAAYLFGSVARSEAREDSDLDVGVVYRARGSDVHERVASSLASELSSATGFEHVDVVDLEAQGPIFCHRVLLEGRRVYEADRARRVDFESDTLVRAFDFRPTYDTSSPRAARSPRSGVGCESDMTSEPIQTKLDALKANLALLDEIR